MCRYALATLGGRGADRCASHGQLGGVRGCVLIGRGVRGLEAGREPGRCVDAGRQVWERPASDSGRPHGSKADRLGDLIHHHLSHLHGDHVGHLQRDSSARKVVADHYLRGRMLVLNRRQGSLHHAAQRSNHRLRVDSCGRSRRALLRGPVLHRALGQQYHRGVLMGHSSMDRWRSIERCSYAVLAVVERCVYRQCGLVPAVRRLRDFR
mmetsp:Transcript_60487/g.174513  ORF Transcript_60487/g.174513 Transcript_60487/m.174513 type:complete len:209 (+) Transcript_60487:130-756(+)